jgi:hypothetical protein
MKGIEFLRGICLSSNVSIKPKTKSYKLEMLKSVIRAYGMDPEKVLMKEAFTEPHRFIQHSDVLEDHVQILSRTLREILAKELATIRTSPETV